MPTALRWKRMKGVNELCNGETSNLISVYRESGKTYDKMKKNREAENNQLFKENSTHLSMNEKLQGYIANIRAKRNSTVRRRIVIDERTSCKTQFFELARERSYLRRNEKLGGNLLKRLL